MSLKKYVAEFNPQKKGISKVLGNLESEIMEIIWKKEEVSVREVHQELSLKRDLAYTTVMTIMGRLAGKKILQKEKRGLAYYYKPVYQKEEFIKIFVGEVLDGLLDEYADFAYLHLFKHFKEDDDKISAIEDIIRKRMGKGE